MLVTEDDGALSPSATLPPGEDASLPLSSGGSYQILVNNVFYFTQRVVDKLWQGMFNKDSKLVVDFIVQLIGQVAAAAWNANANALSHTKASESPKFPLHWASSGGSSESETLLSTITPLFQSQSLSNHRTTA